MRTNFIIEIKKIFKIIRIHFISMLARVQGKECFHLLHIRKTGGTALKEAFNNYRIGSNYIILLHDHSIKLSYIPKRDKVIIFLRDPIRRFVSGFNSRKREGKPRYYFPHTLEEKWAFEKFPTPNSLAEALSDSKKQKDAIRAMKVIGHINTFYKDWLVSVDELLSRKDNIFIGRTETLDKDFEVLKDWMGLKTHRIELPSDPVKAHKTPSGFDTYLSNKAKRNLYEWYISDFKILEIAMQIRRELFYKLGYEP